MVKHIEILEKLKSGERIEVPFDFFIECSFHVMEFWDQISHTVRTETKVDAKGFDTKIVRINEPYYVNHHIEDIGSYNNVKYKEISYDENNLTLEIIQQALNNDVKSKFKEYINNGWTLKPYIEFRRSTNATYYNYQTRKLKLKEFSKMFDDLKDCNCVAYIRDTVKHFDDGLGNVKEEIIKLTHIHFELWRNENKRFESAHKILYKLKNVEERKSILYIN